ncbi:transcription factor TFIIH subunit Tfb4 [Pochonia chlamydosporia 170]|uniref:General transcription and DNA repair factor IIH subunit TFB4 n=1 Tax=Pochonia chlamydosporia 170 TaxID=1380566 RepID=A0A179G7B7_METCM|nr:transcription factor TFIIH subunit Tfb4 [Pochonia chlamydosporia 170]OAQ73303.1 transcription factor TFIIH subunit Tfb4 [Pochonia chlamydosporia 170]
MDAVDVSEHYEVTTAEETPSLLSIVIDTNPRAWAALNDSLPLAKAIANILVFVNAHLAFSNVNQVAVIAAHVNRAAWLYPTPPQISRKDTSGDVQMNDAPSDVSRNSANKYPQFAQIETAVLTSMQKLINETTEQDLEATTTQLSGALTLALCHINKASQALKGPSGNLAEVTQPSANVAPPMKGRILVISVSDSEPSQYIPTMNAVFAAAHAQVAIDTLSLSGDSTFLQQACFNTNGTFLVAANPKGLLTYLMFGLIADTEARQSLITPTHDTVDFRAACFCHGKVVDTGFVCSICLSIFCELPENAECLTCGTKLALGNYGAKPAVVPRKKKKKKRIGNGGSGREETGSATATPLR